MPCIGGVAPCTGINSGEQCRGPFVAAASGEGCHVTSLDYLSDSLVINWTIGDVGPTFKAILIQEGVGVVAAEYGAVTDLTLAIGSGLVSDTVYKLLTRDEDLSEPMFWIDSVGPTIPSRQWNLYDVLFTGALDDAIVDGSIPTYMIDGAIPTYIIDS